MPAIENTRYRCLSTKAIKLLVKPQEFHHPYSDTISQLQPTGCTGFVIQVKELAGQELGKITHQLNDKDRGDYVLKHVIEMAHDDSN